MRNLINFHKMSGSGNDFIVIDNRNHVLKGLPIQKLTQKICKKGLSVGADGLILIENSTKADFKWHYLNADGEEASFCGNGARCAAYYAVLKKIAKPELTFETLRGLVSATVKKKTVKVSMMNPQKIELNKGLFLKQRRWEGHFMVMGVPHWIHFAKDIDQIDVPDVGPRIRNHPIFLPEGTNANFVDILNENELRIRTYERGVEAETLACGTGAAAAALLGHRVYKMSSPVTVYPKGNIPLKIYFKAAQGEFSKIFLEGDARTVFEGFLFEDAWQY
ncbi:MAG: diaminopimelate epimerase [Nitrospirae bacterium]|nr:diaminopimelate epimerase [Nitrospirota bacterium]MBI3353163.1 diaminopimelate epimerase [Nitrospirota bacterium]